MYVIYHCDFCKQGFDTSREAKACESKGVPEPVCAVGDSVVYAQTFGWFDGDNAAVLNFKERGQFQTPGTLPGRNKTHDKNNCFGSCCNYLLRYQVTKTWTEGHEQRYEITTDAMLSSWKTVSVFSYEIEPIPTASKEAA